MINHNFNLLKTFSIIISLIIFNFTLFAQVNKVKISGIVKEKQSGKAIIGANIFVYPDTFKTKLITGASTNRYGFYTIPNLAEGSYFLLVRSIGYETVSKIIRIDDKSKDLKLNLEMLEEDVQLGEIVIRGKKEIENTSQVSAITINTDLLKQLPTMTGEVDLFRTLQLIPGVKTQTEISSGIYVRGSSPDQTLTVLDGVIIYNPSHLGNIATTFNTDALDDVKLIKGAFPAEYGSRLSSVLDIKLRDGSMDKYAGKINLSAINSSIVVEGPISPVSSFMFSARKMYYDNFVDVVNKKSILPRYNFYDLTGKVKFQINDNNWITLSGLKNNDNLYNSPEAKDFGYDIKWGNGTVNLNWTNISNSSNFSNTSLNFTNYSFEVFLFDKQNQTKSNDFYTLSEINDFYLKRYQEIIPSDEHYLKFGVELAYHSYNLLTNNSQFDVVFNDNTLGKKISTLEAALYASDEWKILPYLHTNIGGRFFYFKDDKIFGFEPRISLKYLFNENVAFKLAAAYANQFYHLLVREDIALPTDIWYPSSGKIKPSSAYHLVAGTEAQFKDGEYFISLEGYYKRMSNLYEYNSLVKFNSMSEFENNLEDGEGEAYGFEFFLNKRYGDLTGWIGYSLAWTRRVFDNINNGLVYYPRYDRRHDISVVLNYKFNKHLSLGITWIYGTGQAYTLPNSQYGFLNIGGIDNEILKINYSNKNSFRLIDYHKLDIVLTYQFLFFNRDMQIFAGLYNAYNRQNPFAQYIVSERDENGKVKSLKLKQLVIFPLIPTIGISYKF